MLIGVYHGAVLGGGGGGGEVPRANIRIGRRGVASDMAFIFTAYTSMAVVVGELTRNAQKVVWIPSNSRKIS